MEEAGAVGGAQPDREHAHGGRLREAGADAHGDGLQAVLVPVELGEVLAEALGQTVEGVRAARGVDRDEGVVSPRAGGVADRVVGGGEDDAPHALLAGRLVQVVGALDVGLEDLVERRLEGDSREVDDRVDAADRLAHGVPVGQVRDDRVRLAVDGAHVEQAQRVAVFREQSPHQGAESAGGAGEQNGAGSGHPRILLAAAAASVHNSARHSYAWTR